MYEVTDSNDDWQAVCGPLYPVYGLYLWENTCLGTRLACPTPEPISRMKRTISSLVLAAMALVSTSGSGQTAASKEDQQLLALISDVQAQQARITDNQAKIDAKMAEVMEAIRVARIFAGRGGR
jgi:hypothetical protein